MILGLKIYNLFGYTHNISYIIYKDKIKGMTRNHRLKFKFKFFLRRIGLLCKKSLPEKRRIRVTKTIMPDGNVIQHPSHLERVPENKNSFESALHVYHELKNHNQYRKPKQRR